MTIMPPGRQPTAPLPPPAPSSPVAAPVAGLLGNAPPMANLLPAETPHQAGKPQNEPQGEQAEDENDDEPLPASIREVPGWLVSLVVHMVLLVILGLITLRESDSAIELSATVADPFDSLDELDEPMLEELQIEAPEFDFAVDDVVEADDPGLADDLTQTTTTFDLPLTNLQDTRLYDPTPRQGVVGSDLEGRGQRNRLQRVIAAGGSRGSEDAVAKALRWLANHQATDGSWCFDHSEGTDCRGRCSRPGNANQAKRGATAMGVLPFLGAGHTHQEGQYRTVVYRALRYLVSSQNERTGSLHEPRGTMYSHGLAAIALCEAYAMTKDPDLRPHAQASLDFITAAQDPSGGGWRYRERQPGDTSVVGWQIMALKSGHMAYLNVPAQTIVRAERFLDSVQTDYGSRYGYTGRGRGDATSAIGLLSRMYLGWDHSHPGIQRGIEWLDEQGPSRTNMYYNYYATQVMHHYGHGPWVRWNRRMRDWLIESQATSGHETGSWYMRDPHVRAGGRLYCTSMATMMLEVYYRHMPLYGSRSTEDHFALD